MTFPYIDLGDLMTFSSGSTISGNITFGNTATTNTITVTPWQIPSTTTTATAGTAVTYPYGIYPATAYPSISIDRLGTPSYIDLVEGLRPGDEWFGKGTVLRLKTNSFFSGKDGYNTSMHLEGSVYVYVGPQQDFTTGYEEHWFLADDGSMVKTRGFVYDLGWRSSYRNLFEVVEEKAA